MTRTSVHTAVPPSRRKLRLKDVAAEARVSVATVSMALADHPDISDATKSRVRTVSRRLGYRRSESNGQSLRLGAVILDCEIDSAVNSSLLNHLSEHAQHNLIRCEFIGINDRGNKPEVIDRVVRFSEMLDGVLLNGSVSGELLARLRAAHVPHVLLGRMLGPICEPGGPKVTTVCYDDVGMGCFATQVLFDHGHRRVAYIAEATPPGMMHDRWRRGYQLAHLEQGEPIDPQLIAITGQLEVGAEPAVARLLELADPPTAYVVPDTRIAASLVHSLRKRSIELPHHALVFAGVQAMVNSAALNDYPHLLCRIDQLAEQGLHHLRRLQRRANLQPVEVVVPFDAINMPQSHRRQASPLSGERV